MDTRSRGRISNTPGGHLQCCFTRVLVPWTPVLVGVFQTLPVAAQITDLESANDAKQHRIDELEERVNALVTRMEAVENA